MQCTDCESAVVNIIRLKAIIKQIVRNVTNDHVAILLDNCEPADVLIIKEIFWFPTFNNFIS